MRELYRVWPSALSDVQTDAIIATALHQDPKPATLFSSNKTVENIRVCTVRWLSEQWIKDLLWPYVEKANLEGFNVDVHARAEMQVTEYHAENGGHYDWHHDVNWNGQSDSDRKLSITVQLSPDDAYEGGDFEFEDVHTNADFRSKGTVLIFPSYLRHRVHPVTAGTRRALVAWFFGPRWM